MLTPELAAAFVCTTYSVELPTGTFAICIGEPTPFLNDWLRELHCDCWAYITAFNPQSQQLASHENARRQAELEAELTSRDLKFVRGCGVGDDGQWPPEESCCVAGLSEEQAVELARRFEQLAVVVGSVDGVALLAVV